MFFFAPSPCCVLKTVLETRKYFINKHVMRPEGWNCHLGSPPSWCQMSRATAGSPALPPRPVCLCCARWSCGSGSSWGTSAPGAELCTSWSASPCQLSAWFQNTQYLFFWFSHYLFFWFSQYLFSKTLKMFSTSPNTIYPWSGRANKNQLSK